LNLNPIVELNFVALKFNLIYLESIKSKCNWNSIQVALQCCSCCNFYRNELIFFISRTLGNFSCSTRIFIFFLFFYAFSLGANKKDLLHVTHCIISWLSFDQNSFKSKLFRYDMLLKYVDMLFN
jgi:hypothetical protein